MPRDPLPAWFVVVVLIRFILLAHPVSSLPPKSLADQESLQARWVTPQQLPEYPLRNPEVEQIITYLSSGAPTYPLSTLATEGTSFLCLTSIPFR
jgi:hypothetical protein